MERRATVEKPKCLPPKTLPAATLCPKCGLLNTPNKYGRPDCCDDAVDEWIKYMFGKYAPTCAEVRAAEISQVLDGEDSRVECGDVCPLNWKPCEMTREDYLGIL